MHPGEAITLAKFQGPTRRQSSIPGTFKVADVGIGAGGGAEIMAKCRMWLMYLEGAGNQKRENTVESGGAHPRSFRGQIVRVPGLTGTRTDRVVRSKDPPNQIRRFKKGRDERVAVAWHPTRILQQTGHNTGRPSSLRAHGLNTYKRKHALSTNIRERPTPS